MPTPIESHTTGTPTFQGVVTTGIYCRPGCGGRPLPANVVPFTSAAAAEAAGFRACLQCRPYRWPEAALGSDTSALVCRAVQLVVDGALDDGTEEELGLRLGVSARHLRRLFVAEVGTTPDQLARSRRAHFARRLLDETDLSITDVAFAAGFGSVRQFNRASQDLFHAAPRELRARRRRADRLVADGGLALRLAFRPPLDWDAALAWFAPRAVPGVEHVDHATGTYRRTVVIDGDPGVLELRLGGDDHLVLHAHLPHWEGLIHVVGRARHLAALDLDVASAEGALRRDPLLRPSVARRPGLRVPGCWDPFETGVRIIAGQQVSVAGATTIVGRLVARLGTPVPGLEPMGLAATFPTAAVVVEGDLDGIGLIGARAAAVRAFAAAVAAGSVVLERGMPLDELVDGLVALPGIGPWTAQVLALRLGVADAFPAGDLGLRRALAARFDVGGGRLPSEVEVARRAEAWRPWRAVAAAHLWSFDV